MNDASPGERALCPSAQPDQPGALVFGAQVTRPDGQRHVGYLAQALPVSAALLAHAGPATAPEVLRIAAPCMKGSCLHHEAGACGLAARVAQMLDPVVASLPRCAIRPSCVWFREQGPASCVRCPQVVTDAREGTGIPLDVTYAGGIVPAHVRTP